MSSDTDLKNLEKITEGMSKGEPKFPNELGQFLELLFKNKDEATLAKKILTKVPLPVKGTRKSIRNEVDSMRSYYRVLHKLEAFGMITKTKTMLYSKEGIKEDRKRLAYMYSKDFAFFIRQVQLDWIRLTRFGALVEEDKGADSS